MGAAGRLRPRQSLSKQGQAHLPRQASRTPEGPCPPPPAIIIDLLYPPSRGLAALIRQARSPPRALTPPSPESKSARKEKHGLRTLGSHGASAWSRPTARASPDRHASTPRCSALGQAPCSPRTPAQKLQLARVAWVSLQGQALARTQAASVRTSPMAAYLEPGGPTHVL